MRGRRRVVGVLCAVAFAVAPAAAQAVTPAGYGANDSGGFRNVLPPGENGLDNALQLAQYQANGARPAHYSDQQALYENLLYASPTLTHDQIGAYFKDATFGVRPEDVESTTTVAGHPGLTILRDKQYGIPHIYGDTRADVMFGTGYAAAQDRLFLMDVLRHTGRAQLSSFVGGSAGNRAMDRTQWSLAPYTEQDLQSQVDNASKLYGDAGRVVVDDVTNYVAGINAYIQAAQLNPTLMPGEYAAFGKTPQPWTLTDVIATASLIGGIFGKGGGRELDSALALQAFQGRYGQSAGSAAWSDFRSKNDPEAPTTLAAHFPYETTSPFAATGLALPDAGSAQFTPVGPPLAKVSASSATTTSSENNVTPAHVPVPDDNSFGGRLLRALSNAHNSASNWELVSAAHSATGHAIGVLGPQVGYYVPQILMEEDLHGPGIDARGASFPGVNMYVELGHGRDYAWSATTANSDNVDTFAETLCQDDFHYMYRGKCVAMEQLDRMNSWTPNATDQTPPGSETLTVYRTVHGIVYARGESGKRPVAYVTARTTYFHEADSALGFSQLNDPGYVTGPERFQQAASNINFGFNWAYIDADHIAYYHSGWYPQRADGTSPDFPVLGTGEYDWKGYDPATHTLSVLPFAQHPNAIDPSYLVSWNNKQAPDWAAADDRYAYGPVYRSQMIEAGVKRALANGGKMRIEQLISAMEEPASTDLRMFALWPTLKQILAGSSDPRVQRGVAMLDAWYADGAHRRDLTHSGTDQHSDAIQLMDAWWPKLVDAEFHPSLGDEAFKALKNMIDTGGVTPGAPPAAPDFEIGWWGFVSKDLRDLLAQRAATTKAKSRCVTVRKRVRRRGHRTVIKRVKVCPKRKPAKRHKRRPTARVHHSGDGLSAAKSRARRHARPHRRRRPAKRHPAKPPTTPAAIPGAYSRIYCGGGSLAACRADLQRTLVDAMAVSAQAIYGNGACSKDPQPACYDQNRSTIASGVSMPPFPFQNRPTFQQVAEPQVKLSR